MHGQWLGMIRGDSDGLALIDIDDDFDDYRGHLLFFPDDQSVSGAMVGFRIPKTEGRHDIKDAQVIGMDRLGNLLTPAQVTQVFPDTYTPPKADVFLEITDDGLHVGYQAKYLIDGEMKDVSGEGVLSKSDSTKPSEVKIVEGVGNWDEFRTYVNKLDRPGFIYRGQPCLDRLRTTFHRTRRSDLVRFLEQDVPAVHRNVTPITKHMFNLSDPPQVGALYNLMQHHGYPTPLLDWTQSPFIAAFFAFRKKIDESIKKVRIYLFDRKKWCENTVQFSRVTYLPPHFSVLELLGIENYRMVPQQALATLTNLEDIESYITYHEKKLGGLLYAVDLDSSDRERVLRELSLMGITAASLFPGLDGACEALKGERFGYDL
jgi:hypothetical protein